MHERPDSAWRTDPRLRRSRTVILNTGEPEAKRAEIRQYFQDTYAIDEALFEILKCDETFYLRADPLRHPLIFYFGHTAAFFINKLILAKLIKDRINPTYEAMFAVGVDEMSWDDLNERHYDWPTVADVRTYRDRVRAVVDDLIATLPLQLPISWDSPWWVIMMGIEHERIHLETSSVLIRQLPIEHVRTHPLWTVCAQSGTAPENELLDVASGRLELGKKKDHPLYGWDNEFGTFGAQVKEFRASRYLVSNHEFLGFVEDGGYTTQDWWTDEGWQWRNYKQATHPLFWIPDGTTYRLRTVAEEIDMAWDWPVEVNYLEAKAFCNWKGAQADKTLRLPTEAEWYLLRDRSMNTDQPYWDCAPGNINLEHYASSCPVTEFAFGDFYDIVGNVWQWTETPITGFAGFAVHPFYDDFSTPTFDGLHNLIKGGSWISTGNEATRDSRYAFRRHFFQHAGLRYVESDEPVVLQADVYETDRVVAQYCESHYGETTVDSPNYPASISAFCAQWIGDGPSEKALNIGCAAGRATFELARWFDQVTGIDATARLIRIGTEMQEQGRCRYTRVEEGELLSYHEVTLSDIGLAPTAQRVAFMQADACNLQERYTGYDLVLAMDVIDRLYNPREFLELIFERIKPGGLLVISSPHCWDEALTHKDEWLGGIRVAGEPMTTLEGLRDCLASRFTLVGGPMDVPQVLRETARSYRHLVSEVTAWQRCR